MNNINQDLRTTMKSYYDIEYKDHGLYTRFYANTEAGHQVWNEMAMQNGGVAAVLTIHAKNAIAQLRKAGYSVGKVKPAEVNQTIADILADLRVLS